MLFSLVVLVAFTLCRSVTKSRGIHGVLSSFHHYMSLEAQASVRGDRMKSKGNYAKYAVRRVSRQTDSPLHQFCTYSPQILLISVIIVAQTDVMVASQGQHYALWTLCQVRRAA